MLFRSGARIFRQGRRVDHGPVFASEVRLRGKPTRRQERQGPSEEQRTAAAIHHNRLTAEHTTVNATSEPQNPAMSGRKTSDEKGYL